MTLEVVMNTEDLSGEELDYQMYRHACNVTGQQASREAFEQGYSQGQFHFHQDKALLSDLLETYKLNVQYLAEEWLASNANGSAWGETPAEATCRLVLALHAGS